MKVNSSSILLVDFGSAFEAASVRSYLRNIFTDPHMVGFERNAAARNIVGWIGSMVLERRSKRKYELVKDKELPSSERMQLADKLSEKLNTKVTWATRYAYPTIGDKIEHLANMGYRNVVVVPLFPHHSYATTESIINLCERVLVDRGLNNCNLNYVRSWIGNESFIQGWVNSIRDELMRMGDRSDVHLVFSAHAIPMDHIETKDCTYIDEILISSMLVRDACEVGMQMHVSYSNRSGLGRWVGPSTGETLNKLKYQGVKGCVVIPVSQLFENVETIVDLDHRLLRKYEDTGFCIRRAKPPGARQETVEAIAQLVKDYL